MVSLPYSARHYEPAHLAVSVPRGLAVDSAAVHFLCPPAAWGPAHFPAAVAAVDGCRSCGPVGVCGLASVVVVARMRPRHCTVVVVVVVVAVHGHIRPAGHYSSRRPSRTARIRADRSRNRTVGRRSTDRCNTAAEPAARVADRNIAAAAGAAAGGRRTAAGMPC
jgi:hypothetical protein